MLFDMPHDNLITVNACPKFEDSWFSVDPGDMLVYDDGSAYYVEDVPIAESKQLTMELRCVVAPENENTRFWSSAYMSVNTREALPAALTVVKKR